MHDRCADCGRVIKKEKEEWGVRVDRGIVTLTLCRVCGRRLRHAKEEGRQRYRQHLLKMGVR